MADSEEKQQGEERKPRGFAEGARGLSSEYAHEEGWQLDEAERSRTAETPQNEDGGSNYEYGARDFGDSPINEDVPQDNSTQNSPAKGK